MKKNESPELSAKWWKGSQPKSVNKAAATKLESALGDYEDVKKKLASSHDEGDAKSARDALGLVEKANEAVIAEASKDKKDPEMGFTVDALKKLGKMCDAEALWIEKNTGEDDDGMFSDPDVYQDYLTKALKRLRSGGQMNFGFVLGKKAEDHRLAVHKSKSGKVLASAAAKETGLHVFTFGIAMTPKEAGLAEEEPEGDAPGQEGEEEKPRALVLSLEGKQLPGLGMKGERMLKKFKPQPFNKIILMLEGKVVADIADPDDTDTAPGYDAAALKRELAGLIGRVQALKDPALKGNMARLASQANAGLNGNDLAAAAAAIEKLRQALDAAQANGQGAANGGQAMGGTETYTKSRDIWLATRKKVEAEIEKLRGQIAATYQQEEDIGPELDQLYRAKVASVMTTLDERFATKLDEVSKETNAARRVALLNQARTILQDYQSYVAGDLVPQLDKNPFVELSIQQTVTATVSALGRALH